MSRDHARALVPVLHIRDPYVTPVRPFGTLDPAVIARHPDTRVGVVERDERPCPFCLEPLPDGERDTKDGPTVVLLGGELRWGCTLCVLGKTGLTYLGELNIS